MPDEIMSHISCQTYNRPLSIYKQRNNVTSTKRSNIKSSQVNKVDITSESY